VNLTQISWSLYSYSKIFNDRERRAACLRQLSFLFFAAVVTTVDGGCSGGWQSNFGNEYCADSETEDHSTARSICQSRGGELASITSDAECDYVGGLMSVNRL